MTVKRNRTMGRALPAVILFWAACCFLPAAVGNMENAGGGETTELENTSGVETGADAEKANGTKGKKIRLNERFRVVAKMMENFYEKGNLQEIVSLYRNACLKPGAKKEKKAFCKVKKEIRAEIFHWVILSYSALNMTAEVDPVLSKFLAIRHHEGVAPSDWVALRKRAEEAFFTAPRFLVGLKLGTNFTVIDPGERHTILMAVDSPGTNAYYKNYNFHLEHSRGTQFGLALEYALTKKFSISIQPSVRTLKFLYKNRFIREREDYADLSLEFIHRHNLGYIDVPFLLSYRWPAGKLKPYVQVGGYYGLLRSAEKTLEAVSLPDGDYEEKVILNVKKQVFASNFGVCIGAGIEYEIGGNGLRLQLEANYRHGLSNLADKAQRYENNELKFAYYDVFDNMKARNLSFAVKVLLPLSYKAFRR
ncbi:MAG: PorT family protein [bacterium]|nr:PorT family protein [bacterium]